MMKNNNGKFLDSIHKTDADFNIKNNKVYLKNGSISGGFIAFYAPWCHFCTELAPSWNEYAKQMNDTGFKFLVVNCMEPSSNNTVSALRIMGYPTIKFIAPKTGEIVDAIYNDGTPIDRSKLGIARFLKERNILKH